MYTYTTPPLTFFNTFVKIECKYFSRQLLYVNILDDILDGKVTQAEQLRINVRDYSDFRLPELLKVEIRNDALLIIINI